MMLGKWKRSFLYSSLLHVILIGVVGGLYFHRTPVSSGVLDVVLVGDGVECYGSGNGNESIPSSVPLGANQGAWNQYTLSSSTGYADGSYEKGEDSFSQERTNILHPEVGRKSLSTRKPKGEIGSNSLQGSALGRNKGNDTGAGSGAAGTGSGTGAGNQWGEGFVRGSDGVYTALSAEGIDYVIEHGPDPIYPEEAQEIGYTDTVVVRVRLCVDTDGTVYRVEVLDNPPNLGFRRAVEEIGYCWKFAPIVYQGVPIRMNFIKTFRFQP